MNILFNRKPKENTVSTVNTEPTEPPKKKPRGKPFTGKGDPRNNLTGRPKLGATLAARYRDALAEAQNEANGGDYTKLDAMIDVLIGKAMEGDQRAIEYLQERGFGKVPDRLELANLNTEPKPDFSSFESHELHHLQYLHQKAFPQTNGNERPADPPPYFFSDFKDGKMTYYKADWVIMEVDALAEDKHRKQIQMERKELPLPELIEGEIVKQETEATTPHSWKEFVEMHRLADDTPATDEN